MNLNLNERVMKRKPGARAIGTLLFFLTACGAYQVIPSHLEKRVRTDLTFEQVSQNPDAHEGATVIWAGRVLEVKQIEGKTRVEILQLPLDGVYRPIEAPTAPRGRFMAFDADHDMKNPSSLGKDTLVTVIGEVRGLVKAPLDQGLYEYPNIAIKDMTAWEKKPGIKQTPPGSHLVGFRPFIFWDSRRVADSK